MADYDDLFDAYASDDCVNTVVEISKGSMHKIEYDREHKVFVLDRVEPGIFAKPVNYGFIPKTTDEDGDALDTLVVTEEPLPTGVVLKARIVGVMNFVDGGENDHKIICVPEDDRHTNDAIKTIEDLGEGLKRQIEHHFNHYKDLKKPGSTEVKGFGDVAEAKKVIDECITRFKG